MEFLNIFKTYSHYLIHPFVTHESLLHPEREGIYHPQRLSAYESLATSWIFIIINGIFKVFLLNITIVWLLGLLSDTGFDYSDLIQVNELPGLYFIILSTVLDIIFYPLFGVFIIQYWEVIIKIFGNLLGTTGDISEKAQNIVSVYLSSNMLKAIPLVGAPAQSLAGMILMYAGLRKQLNASPAVSVCIILTPFLFLLGLFSVVLLIVLLTV